MESHRSSHRRSQRTRPPRLASRRLSCAGPLARARTPWCGQPGADGRSEAILSFARLDPRAHLSVLHGFEPKQGAALPDRQLAVHLHLRSGGWNLENVPGESGSHHVGLGALLLLEPPLVEKCPCALELAGRDPLYPAGPLHDGEILVRVPAGVQSVSRLSARPRRRM